jgi:transporter family protein
MTAFYYALITSLIWGCVPIIEKIGLSSVKPSIGLFYRGVGVLIATVLFGSWLTISGENIKADFKSIFYLAFGGFLASFVGQFLFYRALKSDDASVVVPVAASYPMITLIIGALILHERITVAKVIGVCLIFAGVFLLKGK